MDDRITLCVSTSPHEQSKPFILDPNYTNPPTDEEEVGVGVANATGVR